MTQRLSDDEVWAVIHRERAALADVLETLTPEQWERPSLCEGWKVRDVAAHVMASAQAAPLPVLVGLVKAGFSFNRFVDATARKAGARPTEEIVADYRRLDGSRRRPPGTHQLDPLTDILVHTQDILVPLGITHAMPPEAAAACIGRVLSLGFVFGKHPELDGVRLEATDTDWSRDPKGDTTDTLRAPAGALLLLATGRRTRADLSGS